MRHSGEHKEEILVHVPETVDKDVEISVLPLGDNQYRFTPFPFKGNELVVHLSGRYFRALNPASAPEDLGALLYGLPTEQQSFTFVN